jgi:hypothetical protein
MGLKFGFSLQKKKKYKVREFENKVLRRIFRPMKEEETGTCKIYNKQFHSLYSSPNIGKVIKAICNARVIKTKMI